MDVSRWQWSVDGWIVLVGGLCAANCALLGCWLQLRRMSLLSDAISHAVLPGIVLAYAWGGTRGGPVVLLAAAFFGVLCFALIESLQRGEGRIESGAATGVVFTGLFALGLLWVARGDPSVDLDPSCVLYGQLELIPLDMWRWQSWQLPRLVVVLLVISLIHICLLLFFYKPLQLAVFDPQISQLLGFRPVLVHYAVAAATALLCVASFEAVGTILVVAMFTIPPAAARLLSHRLPGMLLVSLVIALGSSLVGHWGAVQLPRWVGYGSTSSSGGMALAAAACWLIVLLVGPRQSWLGRWRSQRRLQRRLLEEDLLAWLYRQQESQGPTSMERPAIRGCSTGQLRRAAVRLRASGYLQPFVGGLYRLTEAGHRRAEQLVRSHRLWEQFLTEEPGLAADRIHPHAERFEHFTDRRLRDALDQETGGATQDPHGSRIPPEP
jgi:manganese/zinc/iron transport system permease protein